MAKTSTKALCDPAIRAKARAAYKRHASLRVVNSIATLDLTPINEQIADLKAKLAKLENAKRIILQLRGEPEQADPPAENGNGKPLLPCESESTWTVEQIRARVHQLLEEQGGGLELVALSKRLHMPAAVIQKALADDVTVLYGRWGYKLNS